MNKRNIVLSSDHPSLLVDNLTEAAVYSPVIVNQDCVLVDGYRRFRMEENEEIQVVCMNVSCLYTAAFEMNRHTRSWDDIDCFFWARWAQALGLENAGSGRRNYPHELFAAPESMLRALANRRLQLGQAIRILQTPSTTWPFFIETLSSKIRLNVNETAAFIDMIFDLANRWQTKNLTDVLQKEPLQQILSNQRFDVRQTGEALLKAMRTLRYPLHQRKVEELSTAWRQVNLEKWQAKQGLLLERGVLEITIRACSQVEMTEQVQELFESLSLPAWNQIWNHDS